MLFLYIFKKMGTVISSLTLILMGVIWLTQSLRFIEVIVNHNVSFFGYFSLIIFLIPDLIATVLPICVLITGFYVFYKMITEHELLAMRASGFSNRQISSPIICLGILAASFIYLINLYIMPLSFQKFRDQEHQIRNQFSTSMIREGMFNPIRGTTVYVRERTPQNELKGILIHHEDKKASKEKTGTSYTVIAELGSIKQMNGRLILLLKKGNRQEKDPTTGKITFLSFDTFAYDISDAITNADPRSIKPYELSTFHLFNPKDTDDPLLRARMRTEAHQRLITPLFAIIDALIACFFMLSGAALPRRQQRHRVVMGIGATILVYASVYGTVNMSTHHPKLIYLSYALMAVFIAGLLALLQDGWERRT
ncbi:MAG: LptF/LptG family permease [Alphaproteobacteria bacterium]|nr:LptF/LptG family permease [Alphaproteobacteria bacterium]